MDTQYKCDDCGCLDNLCCVTFSTEAFGEFKYFYCISCLESMANNGSVLAIEALRRIRGLKK